MPKTTLRLLGSKLRVIEQKSVQLDGQDCYATFDPSGLVVKLRVSDQTDEQCETYVLHECLHAISHLLHLGLTEKQIIGLEVGLTSLLRDNGGSLKALRK